MGTPVVHFEIGCRDNQKTQKFYEKLFGWKMTPYGPAAMIDTGSSDGIKGHINTLGHEPHNYVTIYIEVDDIPKTLETAGQNGGKMLVPMQAIPGMGHFAWMADPDGNIIGLWKSAPKSA
jgi:predicted enzyme related to lactoylglutathione lyase